MPKNSVEEDSPSEPVKRVIQLIRQRFHEPLPLSELAATAMLSPFHFSRTFRRETGVSPGRYLAAVRMFEAKRLLLTTTATVADISCRVGYSSVGTFTTRFTRSVGVPPNQYRQMPRDSIFAVDRDLKRLPEVAPTEVSVDGRTTGTVVGRFRYGADTDLDRSLVGVFADPIPQSHPVACQLVHGDPGQWELRGVPVGEWVVLVLATQTERQVHAGEAPVLIGSSGTVSVRAAYTTSVTLGLRAPKPTDPPILLTVRQPVAA